MSGLLPGIGSHHSARAQTDEWLTPKFLIDALGPFDLDPCAPAEQPWPTAGRKYTIDDDGLMQEWAGHIWLNPPYSTIATWMSRMRAHDDGIACVFARTETAWWFDSVWPAASALLFLRGRLTFHRADGLHQRADGGSAGGGGNAGAPTALVGYGPRARATLERTAIAGALITEWRG